MADDQPTFRLRADLIRPLPSQEQFLDAMYKYEYVLFGGSAGPGKSYILRWGLIELLLRWAQDGIPNVTVGLFCEDYPTLKDRQITKMQREFPEWLGQVKESQTDGFSFQIRPEYGGGRIALRNLDNPAKYASAEFAAIAVDELTKNDKQTFDDLRFRKRWPGIEHSPFIAATNPGSKGHSFVKKLWVDRDFSGDDSNLNPETFHFIPAKAGENPNLPHSYFETLNSLPPQMRKAMLDGDWSIFVGQGFEEWRQNRHVVQQPAYPLELCDKIIGFDWGYNHPGVATWLAYDPNGHVWAYRELHQKKRDPMQWANDILKFTKHEKVDYIVLPHDCFSRLGGWDSIASIFERKKVAQVVRGETQTAGSRHLRKALMHYYLADAPDMTPRLQFLPTCPNAIRTIPNLVISERDPEDIEKTTDVDDPYDSITIALMTKWKQRNRGNPNVMPKNNREIIQLIRTPEMNVAGEFTSKGLLDKTKRAYTAKQKRKTS